MEARVAVEGRGLGCADIFDGARGRWSGGGAERVDLEGSVWFGLI